MKKEVEKQLKLAANPGSYKEFVRAWRKMGKMTRATHDVDQDAYWQMVWHHQSMEYAFLEAGWPTAAKYHTIVMELWEADFVDAASHIDTEVFRRGNVKMAMSRDSYFEAVNKVDKGGAKPGGHSWKGTKEKKSSDDTWCDEHQAFFSKGENHKWSWASKSGSCNVAKSKLGKSK